METGGWGKSVLEGGSRMSFVEFVFPSSVREIIFLILRNLFT